MTTFLSDLMLLVLYDFLFYPSYDFMANVMLLLTGSENNSMYIYFKGLSKHLLTYKFDTVRCILVCCSMLTRL